MSIHSHNASAAQTNIVLEAQLGAKHLSLTGQTTQLPAQLSTLCQTYSECILWLHYYKAGEETIN